MTWNAAAINHLFDREGYAPRWALWCVARNRETGADEPFGIWQGDDDENIEVDGVTRLFAGAQGALEIGTLRRSTGVVVRSQTVTLTASPEVLQLTRVYDLEFARADLYCVLLDPNTQKQIDNKRMFKGYVDTQPQALPAKEGTATVQLSLVSHFRELTACPGLFKSNAAQEALSGDTFCRDATMADATDDPWG